MKHNLSLLALVGLAPLFLAPRPVQGPESAEPRLLEVGKPAPVVRLNDHTGRAVHLRPADPDEEGNWKVLAFFPKAATPG
jgi:hypothetical protein